MEAAMPCKLRTMKRPLKQREVDSESNGSNKIQKNQAFMHRGSSGVHERAFGRDSTERSRTSHCGDGVQFIESFSSCAEVCSFAPSNENSRCKGSSGQRVGEARKVAGLAIDQSKEQKGGYSGSTKKQRTIRFAALMDICHLKNAELEPQYPKYKGWVVLRGDNVKDDSGSFAVFKEQGSSASQRTAAELIDVIARLPDCSGQAADAVSA